MLKLTSGLTAPLTLPVTQGLSEAYSRTQGGGVIVLPDFVYQAETDALVATFSAAPSTRRKKTIDRFIKRMKTYPAGDPVWPRLIRFEKAMADANGARRNWVNPAQQSSYAGGALTPTDTGVAPVAGRAINTGMLANALPVDDWMVGVYIVSGTAGSLSDIGVRDASNNGITFQGKSSTTNTATVRGAGAVTTTVANTTDWDNARFHAVQRKSSSEYEVWKGPVKKATIAAASVALPALAIYWGGSNVNGTATEAGTQQSAFVVARSLTDAQINELTGAIERLHVEMGGAEIDDYQAGTQPQQNTFDVVVYGATSGGVIAAQAAKRRGKTVCIVGERNIRRLGGMSSGGLGYADIYNTTALSGYSRYTIERIKVIAGSSTVYFQPRNFERVMRELLDPTKTGGVDVPVFWSNGLDTVTKTGARISKIKTLDGREFSASEFIDASYLSDLMVKAGVSNTTKRETAGSGYNAVNGYRGVLTANGSDEHQFTLHNGTLANVDPFVTPGVPASGLIAGVHGTFVSGNPANGSEDTGVQAFNYRLITTTDPAIRVPMPSTPPAGYATANYEALLRLFALDPTIVLGDIVKADAIATTANGFIYDVNSNHGMSSDLLGDFSRQYVNGTQQERDAIRRQVMNWIIGFWYLLQYDADPRIPAAVRTSALSHGYPNMQFGDWLEGDQPWFSPQLYEREGPRMISDLILDGNDICATDGTVPRSIKTIATGSYFMDSHHVRRLAYEYTPGSWKIWNEGNFLVTQAGGTNQISPIPYEIIVPKAAECTNLFCLFGCSANHAAFGTIRMELTFMEMAQAAAEAACIAIDSAVNVQDVDYTTLRGKLQEAPVLTGQNAMYLPQVN